jgi:hypothetical protein
MLSAHVKTKEVCVFRRAHRLELETANEFAKMRLRSLAAAAQCSFTELEK